jgi:hypothetical protein
MRTRLKGLLALLVAISLLSFASVASAHGGKKVRLEARLTGAQEVPPADPDGRARAKVWIDVDAGEVCFDIRGIRDVGIPNRGHIHRGVAGVNGGIVVTFFELRIDNAEPPPRALPTDPRNDALESGRLSDCVPGLDPVLLAEIAGNPAGFYVNLHNSRFPGGALRCQLER